MKFQKQERAEKSPQRTVTFFPSDDCNPGSIPERMTSTLFYWLEETYFCFLTIKMVQEKIFKEVNCLWAPWDSIRHLFAAMLSPPHTKKQELRILFLHTPGLEHLYYWLFPLLDSFILSTHIANPSDPSSNATVSMGSTLNILYTIPSH